MRTLFPEIPFAPPICVQFEPREVASARSKLSVARAVRGGAGLGAGAGLGEGEGEGEGEGLGEGDGDGLGDGDGGKITGGLGSGSPGAASLM